jgi:translation initiation factor IF-2
VTSDVAPAPKAVIAEGVMPLPASAPAVPAAPAPEPQSESATLPVESLLLRFRMITPAQLADAMKEEAVSGKSVATIVVEKGWVTAEAMAQIVPAEPAFAAAPAPAVEPPAVEAPVVEVAAPAPEPAPAAPEPVAPLMPEPVAEQPFPEPEVPVAAAPPAPFVPEPEPETLIEALAPVVEPPAPEPETAPVVVAPEPEPAPVSAPLVFQVLAHLTNGERVEISRAGDMDEAKAAASAATHALRDGGDWPLLSGRYVRPESIISIDVAVL